MRQAGGVALSRCMQCHTRVAKAGLTDLRNSQSLVPSVLSKQTGLYIVGAKGLVCNICVAGCCPYEKPHIQSSYVYTIELASIFVPQLFHKPPGVQICHNYSL
jgi:hypothetical protein